MKKVFAILFVMLMMSACAPVAPFRPATGFLYTEIKAPLSIEFDNQKRIKTSGEAQSTFVAYYIFSFSIGDNSLQKAIKDGVLKDAQYVDYEWKSVLSIFGRLTVRAYGWKNPEEDW